MPVLARNWIEPVRVCNDCRHQLLRQPNVIPGKLFKIIISQFIEHALKSVPLLRINRAI